MRSRSLETDLAWIFDAKPQPEMDPEANNLFDTPPVSKMLRGQLHDAFPDRDDPGSVFSYAQREESGKSFDEGMVSFSSGARSTHPQQVRRPVRSNPRRRLKTSLSLPNMDLMCIASTRTRDWSG